MKYAVIDKGLVVNAIELTDVNAWPVPAGQSAVASAQAGPGWTFDGVAFKPPAAAPLTPEEQAARDKNSATLARRAVFAAEPDEVDLHTRIQNSTPAQIDAWLLATVTNIVQARTVLGAIVKYLARTF